MTSLWSVLFCYISICLLGAGFSENSANSSLASPKLEYIFIARVKHNHSGAIIDGRADGNAQHQVVLSLKQNLEELTAKLDRVARTSEQEYGQFLQAKDISDLARPESVSHLPVLDVLSKMRDVAVTKISPFGDYIHIKAPVRVLEVLFNTQFYVLRPSPDYLRFISLLSAGNNNINSEEGTASTKSLSDFHAIRAFEYSLPVSLAEHVGAAFGTIQHPFAVNKANSSPFMSSTSTSSSSTNGPQKLAKIDDIYTQYAKHSNGGLQPQYQPPIIGYIYPQLLEAHYSIATVDITGKLNGNDEIPAQVVFSGTNQYASAADLATFQTLFNQPPTPIQSVGGHLMDTPCTQVNDCIESNLDVEYILTAAPQVPTINWYEPDMSSSSFNLFLAAVNELDTAPGVISMSYAMLEALLSSDDRYYFDVEAAKLALRGVTIVAASGDNGVAGLPSALACGYNPLFPASSPFVTAVGGTFGTEYGFTETAAEGDLGEPFTTGGGFSNIYRQPWWQRSAIQNYFDKIEDEYKKSDGKVDHRPYESKGPNIIFYSKYNRGGRGYPDLSLAATNYIVVVNSSTYVVSGTSCAAPVVAGMISLANLQRAVNGKGTVGWINPLLYTINISVAIDIPNGNNHCFSGDDCCVEGFYSTEGWDPVTGLGAVNGEALHHMLVSLPYTLGKSTDPHSDKDFDSNKNTMNTGTMSEDKWSVLWMCSGLGVLVLLGLGCWLVMSSTKKQNGNSYNRLASLCNVSLTSTPSRTPSGSGSPTPSRTPPQSSTMFTRINSDSPSYQFKYGAVSTSEDVNYDRLAFARAHSASNMSTGTLGTSVVSMKKTVVNAAAPAPSPAGPGGYQRQQQRVYEQMMDDDTL